MMRKGKFVVNWRPMKADYVDFCRKSPEMFLNLVMLRNVPRDPGSHFCCVSECLLSKKKSHQRTLFISCDENNRTFLNFDRGLSSAQIGLAVHICFTTSSYFLLFINNCIANCWIIWGSLVLKQNMTWKLISAISQGTLLKVLLLYCWGVFYKELSMQ